MARTDHFRGIRRVLAVLAITLVAAGCTRGNVPEQAPAEQRQGRAAGLTELGQTLPERIQTSRELRVGSDISYAPFEFYDALAPDVLERPAGEPEPTVRGVDYELAVQLAEKLGVRVSFVQIGFDQLLTKLNDGDVDVVMSAMNATSERAKTATFLEYFQAGTSILVQQGNPKNINRLTDLCGKTVAYQQDTVQADIAAGLRARCGDSEAPIELSGLSSGTQAILAVKAGKADACLTDFPVAAYNAKVSGGGNDFEIAGDPIDPAPYGIAIRKGNERLEDALSQAFAAIVEDGGYNKVLTRWNLTDGALTEGRVRG
jgi:polar amino acid transport system substrate-binding protein